MELIGVCRGPTVSQAKDALQMMAGLVDGVELRVDLFEEWDIAQIGSLLSLWDKQIILTAHDRESEPFFPLWDAFFQLPLDYIDLSFDCPDPFYTWIVKQTPDLDAVLSQIMQKKADVYKIACHARSCLDSLKMMSLSMRAGEMGVNFVGICMGEYGALTRILAPVVKSCFNYVHVGQGLTAEGQLEVHEFLRLSQNRSLGPSSRVYGLLGENIEKSLSPYLHNHVFSKVLCDAVYVKFPIRKGEVEEFFHFFRAFPFMEGLSVTSPYKELCIAHMDQVDDEARLFSSVNTVVKNKGLLIGSNTDSHGGVIAIRQALGRLPQRALVLGSGPAARSIAYGLSQHHCQVDMGCRDVYKAAQLLPPSCATIVPIWDLGSKGYDVIVNATSSDAPIEIKDVKDPCLVVDINYMEGKSLFLQSLEKQGAMIADGKGMLIHQAALQQMTWFDHLRSTEVILSIMQSLIPFKILLIVVFFG